MEWRCLRQSWPSLNFMIFLGSLSLFLTLLSMIRHLFLGGGCWLQDVNSSLLFTQGTPICRGITWILQSQPWPSVMVKATDVRCQPLASRLTVEGYSTDWTEMPCPETRNLERQLGKKGYQSEIEDQLNEIKQED
ncbi:uncharacterized protein LOC104003155 isoform X3 [Pan troglodytes]|uniref:uncharacterized protein LOC104003155 isoform X3 n=1 Tax=Pan troglodytes TaxID=9598 RepID=UPI0023F4CF3E|nr:uncharacterized protein LOC104003155 isoform X2 [Pan troglodytes]